MRYIISTNYKKGSSTGKYRYNYCATNPKQNHKYWFYNSIHHFLFYKV